VGTGARAPGRAPPRRRPSRPPGPRGPGGRREADGVGAGAPKGRRRWGWGDSMVPEEVRASSFLLVPAESILLINLFHPTDPGECGFAARLGPRPPGERRTAGTWTRRFSTPADSARPPVQHTTGAGVSLERGRSRSWRPLRPEGHPLPSPPDASGTATMTDAASPPPGDLHSEILIVGAGSAGISVAARLRKAHPPAEVTILDPSTRHYYQPLWTLVGAGVDKEETEREQAAHPRRRPVDPGAGRRLPPGPERRHHQQGAPSPTTTWWSAPASRSTGTPSRGW
jgi:hypothetical protein